MQVGVLLRRRRSRGATGRVRVGVADVVDVRSVGSDLHEPGLARVVLGEAVDVVRGDLAAVVGRVIDHVAEDGPDREAVLLPLQVAVRQD